MTDLQARAKLLSINSPIGYNSCPFCNINGKSIQTKNKRKIIFDKIVTTIRKDNNFYGYNEIPTIYSILKLHPPLIFLVDLMHLLVEGNY